MEAITPVTLEVALSVQQELQSRLEEADRLRQQQVERSRYEAELARLRYLRVDPDNRLVADSLEADWNARLKMLAETQELCERQREQDQILVTDQQRAAILSLANSFPATMAKPCNAGSRTQTDGPTPALRCYPSPLREHHPASAIQGRRAPHDSTAPTPPVLGAAATSK